MKNQWTKEKLDVISRPEKGEWIVDVDHNVRLAHISLRAIRDNTDRLNKVPIVYTNLDAKNLKQGVLG